MLSKKSLLNLLPLILIIFLASALRLWMLGSVPISLSDDEIRETYVAYSIAHTAKDYYGNFLPAVFKMDGFNTYGPLPIYLSSLFYLFLPLNPFIARLPYALSAIGCIFLLYLVVKKLLNNNKIALASSFVLAVSVWHIQLSRFVIESNISLFFYLLAILVFLYSSKKIKWMLLSMVLFFLSFYGYSAHKLFLLPSIVTLTWYRFKELSKKKLLMIIVTIFLAFGSYGILGVTQKALDYGGYPFFFLDKNKTSFAVELERRASNEPNFIETLYHNKFTYWTRIFTTNYLTAFSPQYLFLDQEANGIYSIWGRGVMYFIELPLLIIGFVYLYIKKRKEFFVVLLFLLASPLPSGLGVNSPTWMSRSELMVLWLSIFVGAGIYSLLTLFRDKKYQALCLALISTLYIYAIVGYVSQYYFDWSQTNAKYFSKSTKDLVEKINSYQSQGKHVIVSGGTGNTLLHLAFYNKIDPSTIQKIYKNKPILFQNIVFMEDCWVHAGSPYDKIRAGNVYISKVSCQYEATPSAKIKEHAGSEVVWNIYER